MNTIYFAGKSQDWQSIRKWIEIAEECGHTITFDWTKMVEQHGRGNREETPKEVLVSAAVQDCLGVWEAEVLVLFPRDGVYGAMTELGIALATSTTIYVVGEWARYSVFFDHPKCEHITEDELLTLLASGRNLG